jgi:hypothetical protein
MSRDRCFACPELRHHEGPLLDRADAAAGADHEGDPAVQRPSGIVVVWHTRISRWDAPDRRRPVQMSSYFSGLIPLRPVCRVLDEVHLGFRKVGREFAGEVGIEEGVSGAEHQSDGHVEVTEATRR